MYKIPAMKTYYMKSIFYVLLISFLLITACKNDEDEGLTAGKMRITVNGIPSALAGGSATHISVYGQDIITLVAYRNVQKPQEEQVSVSFQNVQPEISHTYTFGYISQANHSYIQGAYIKTVENIPMSYLTTGYENYTGTLTFTNVSSGNLKGTFTFRAVNTVNIEQSVEVSGEFNLNIVQR